LNRSVEPPNSALKPAGAQVRRRLTQRWADERRVNAPMTTRESLQLAGLPTGAGRL
jgi:hypothetical protein